MSNLEFPRLCAKLFLVTLNIAWHYVVPSEDHISSDDDTKRFSAKSAKLKKSMLYLFSKGKVPKKGGKVWSLVQGSEKNTLLFGGFENGQNGLKWI